jgi:5-phospho-D-xylono-1,4-lactonase
MPLGENVMTDTSLIGKIMTVRGPVEASALGFCHTHEHLFNDNAFAAASNPDLLIDSFENTMEELALFRKSGGGCVVDAQPVGCGRVAEWLSSASWLSGVRIVASTGFHKLGFYPPGHWIHTIKEDEALRLFMSEAVEGMYEHGEAYPPAGRINAKPGVIKVAVDSCGIVGRYAELLCAAAECSKQTGLPLLCHLEMGQGSKETLAFLQKCGVKPGSIILCHLDRTLEDMGRICEAASAGVFMEFDTIGRPKYHGDGEEAALILGLVEGGFGGNILLGLDTTRARLKSYGGSIGLDYLASDFLPRLRQNGVPEKAVHQFMFENPARALTIKQ